MRKTVTAVALALGVALGSLGISGWSSISQQQPDLRLCGRDGGLLQGPAIRPREIAFGALYDVARLSWSSWSSGTAHGRGHYYGFGSYEANVKLYDVKIHHGRRYFSWIKIAEHGHKTRHLKYSGGLWRTR
jgi:hypothetical protein